MNFCVFSPRVLLVICFNLHMLQSLSSGKFGSILNRDGARTSIFRSAAVPLVRSPHQQEEGR